MNKITVGTDCYFPKLHFPKTYKVILCYLFFEITFKTINNIVHPTAQVAISLDG
jgi:hypothetical protein